MKKIVKSLVLIPLLLLSSCSSYSLSTHLTGVREVNGEFISPLDTVVTIKTFEKSANSYVDDNFDDIIWKYHEEIDRFHAYNGVNNIYTINENIGKSKEIVVSEELFSLIKEAVKITKMTKGIFNPCLGEVIDLWTPKFNNGTMSQAITFSQKDLTTADIWDKMQFVPTYENIDEYVILNETNHSVRLNKVKNGSYEGTFKLSLGAIGKGYVLDKVNKELKARNYQAMTSLGSSSLSTVGNYPGRDASKWRISYSNPSIEDIKDEKLFTIEYEGDMNISTSSDSEKHYCIIDEKEGYLMRCHILNGVTGKSNNYYRTVSVMSKDCPNYALDALSTTIFNINNRDDVFELVKAFEDYYQTKIEYFLCRPYTYQNINEYDITMTSGMNALLRANSKTNSIKSLSIKEK